jgi:hypothetical protein
MRYGNMTLTVEAVTPAISSRWLAANTSNRRLRKAIVEQYAADMRSGAWERKPIAICFDELGLLGNGQHTLNAIVMSGVTQELLIARNVPKSAIAVMDVGLKRTLNDIAHFIGADVNTMAAGIARIVEFGVKDGSAKSFSVLLDAYQKHRDAVDFVLSVMPMKQLGFSTTLGAVLARATYTQDKARLARFVEVLKTGTSDGPHEAGAIRVRDFSRSLRGAHSAALRVELYQKAQSGLAHFLKGTPVTKLYGSEDELFMVP